VRRGEFYISNGFSRVNWDKENLKRMNKGKKGKPRPYGYPNSVMFFCSNSILPFFHSNNWKNF